MTYFPGFLRFTRSVRKRVDFNKCKSEYIYYIDKYTRNWVVIFTPAALMAHWDRFFHPLHSMLVVQDLSWVCIVSLKAMMNPDERDCEKPTIDPNADCYLMRMLQQQIQKFVITLLHFIRTNMRFLFDHPWQLLKEIVESDKLTSPLCTHLFPMYQAFAVSLVCDPMARRILPEVVCLLLLRLYYCYWL